MFSILSYNSRSFYMNLEEVGDRSREKQKILVVYWSLLRPIP